MDKTFRSYYTVASEQLSINVVLCHACKCLPDTVHRASLPHPVLLYPTVNTAPSLVRSIMHNPDVPLSGRQALCKTQFLSLCAAQSAAIIAVVPLALRAWPSAIQGRTVAAHLSERPQSLD